MASPSSSLQELSSSFAEASSITVAFTAVYVAALVNQVVCKKRLLARATKKANKNDDKVFDRYAAAEMRNPDRLVANLMEWGFVFLPLVWSLGATGRLVLVDGGGVEDDVDGATTATTTSSTACKVAWAYVVLRVLYVILQIKYGVATGGRNTRLWISTLPSYICLAYLLVKAV